MIRDAQRQAPALYSDRLPRKSRVSARSAAATTARPVPKSAAARTELIERICEETISQWHREVREVRTGAGGWMQQASASSSADWCDACSQKLTDFSLGVMTQDGFQQAAAVACVMGINGVTQSSAMLV